MKMINTWNEIREKKMFFLVWEWIQSFTWWFMGIYICTNYIKLHGVGGKKKIDWAAYFKSNYLKVR